MGATADRPAPVEPPEDVLQRFLFYLARDYASVGMVEHCLALAVSPALPSEHMASYPELSAMTERWAGVLHRTPVGG